jgi:CO/xanthine dehydrogenase Mo-binding subunit
MTTAIPTSFERCRPATRRFIGKDVKRVEDRSLVTGTASSSTTSRCPACCTARSCAARIRMRASCVKVDTSRAAEALPGVAAVLTGEDVKRWCNPAYTAPEGWGPYCMAVDKVRFVGEPVAAVAASSRYIAEDASS